MKKSRLGHYRILRKIGAGGMGEVHLAEDDRLGRRVALKVLPEKMANDADRLARFEQEAKLVAALNHPGIVTLHSLEHDEGTRFLTMELIEGKTLREYKHGERVGPDQLVQIAAGISDALRVAHAAGITHRDLKPANIMVTHDGRVKILDFGLAKLQEAPTLLADARLGGVKLGDADETMSEPRSVVGTIGYMAPEQAMGQPADARSDIFAVGITLYELAAGIHPFPQSSPILRMTAIIKETPAPVLSLAPQLPIPLARAIDRCLCKEPHLRFQNAGDLLDALTGATVELGSTEADRLQSIAVLPFRDLSAGRDQEYFCEGLAQEMLDALASLDGLRIASPTSSMQFKDRTEDVRRVAENLSVESILEGSLRTSGEKVRITVQLTSAADGYLVWSGRFDRELDDVFSVQGDIASRVVKALGRELVGVPPTDPPAL